MNEPNDVSRAWEFLVNFRIPVMSVEERDKWSSLIEQLSADEFQRGCRESRRRKIDALKFRPGIEEFRAYALRMAPPRVADHLPRNQSGLASPESNREWMAKCRAILAKEAS